MRSRSRYVFMSVYSEEADSSRAWKLFSFGLCEGRLH